MSPALTWDVGIPYFGEQTVSGLVDTIFIRNREEMMSRRGQTSNPTRFRKAPLIAVFEDNLPVTNLFGESVLLQLSLEEQMPTK